MQILEFALSATQLGPRRLRGRPSRLDLLAYRGGARACAVERDLQLRVAAGLDGELVALIDQSPCRGVAFQLAEFRLDDLVGLGFPRLPAREA